MQKNHFTHQNLIFRTLTPYTAQQLTYPSIEVTGMQIIPEGGQPNVMQTFWQQSDIDLSTGLDFSPRGAVFVRFTHLQHTPFNYVIAVNNRATAARVGMVRIFMAPKFNDRGQEFPFSEQRKLMVEMERFIATSKFSKVSIKFKL